MIDFISYKRIVNFCYLDLPERVYECVPCLITRNVLNFNRLYIAQNLPRKEYWMEEKVAFHKHPIRYFYNDLQAKISRRNKKVKDFFIGYKKSKKVTEVFQTLTNAVDSRIDIREFIKLQKQYLQRNGVKVLKYIWVLELKRRDDKTIHCHYHIVWFTQRTRRIKLWYKGGNYWGQRVNSSFVEKSAKSYLMKYLSKTDLMCANHRVFGTSVKHSERLDKTSIVSQINSNYYYHY